MKSAFTLIEILISILILIILSTIGFISYSSYIVSVRDSSRIAKLNNIKEGVSVKIINGDNLLPYLGVNIKNDGKIFSNQGFFGEALMDFINYTDGKDPKDNSFFTFSISESGNNFKLMTFLENNSYLKELGFSGNILVSNNNRIPFVVGNSNLPIFLDEDIIPIQNKAPILNITSTDSNIYNLIINNGNYITSTGGSIFSILDSIDSD